jgi:hypothetical protein
VKNNSEGPEEKHNGHSMIELAGFFSYERLKARSNDPAPGVDPKRREVSKHVWYSGNCLNARYDVAFGSE